MDPLTAFGLACNVIQVLSFGNEALSLCRRVCRDGSPEPDLAYNTAHLQNLSKKLLESLNAGQTSDKLSKEQYDLRQIASKLMIVTTQLSKLMDEVTVDGAPSRRTAVANTMKYLLRYKGKIQTLQNTMESFQNTLNSRILAHLCSTSEASALESQQGFSKLDQNLQHFIQQCAQGNQTITALISREAESIKEHVSAESAKTLDRLAVNIQDIKLTTSTADRYKRFLDSLKYDEMNGRRSTIAISHKETYQWILEDSIRGPWDSFAHWLKSDDKNFYWISGKASSGKSTLIKFIIGNDKIKKALFERNPNTTIIAFFFWNSGTKMQRSITGMLCSLLHQILRENMTSVTELLREESTLSHKESIFDWSIEELQQVVLKVLSNRTYSYCLFIDGLDEVEHMEGQAELVRILHKFRCQPNVKLCVSSRPEPALQEALKSYPKLRLQDLTRNDIRRFVSDALGPLEKDTKSERGKSRTSLVDLISYKADGVFLWAKLVAKSLQTGITNADDWDTLTKRVDRLPRDIHQLYDHMWSRLNEDQELYRSEAAFYFKFILEGMVKREFPEISLFELMVASERSLGNQILDEGSGELLRLCRVVEKRVTARCAGLLEVVSNLWDERPISSNTTLAARENGQDTSLAELKKLSMKTRLAFIHRSAREFLLETDAGRQILSYCSKSNEEYWSDLIRATMAQAILSTPNPAPGSLEEANTVEGLGQSGIVMQGFTAAQGALSEQTEFKLLDLYRKTLHQEFESIIASLPFLCLAARFGHFAYVCHHVKQLESKYGHIPTETKTRLLCSASTWMWSWETYFVIHNYLQKMTPGKIELVSWLLENGADPNLMIVGRNGECETPFSLILKENFIGIVSLPGSGWEGLNDQMSVGVQRFFDFAGDLRTRTLLYFYKPRGSKPQGSWHPPAWDLDVYWPVPRGRHYLSQKDMAWIIVIQVNCSWLARAIIANREAKKSRCEGQILALKCGDVEPEFKVLQVFSGKTRLTEPGLDTFFAEHSSNLVGLLQDRLKFPYNSSSKKGLQEKITTSARELYESGLGKTEEGMEDWIIRKGYVSE